MRKVDMLRWSLTLFAVAVIAAMFGFGGMALGAAAISEVLFCFILLIFLVAMMYGVGT
jgi:uncharacterized membrane protein YtjA (UPF0391 family)